MMLRYLIRFNLLLPDARALVTESQLRSKIEPETNGNRKKRQQVENNSLTGKDETMLSIVWIIVSFLVSIFLYHRLQTSILWIWCTVGRFLCVCRNTLGMECEEQSSNNSSKDDDEEEEGEEDRVLCDASFKANNIILRVYCAVIC